MASVPYGELSTGAVVLVVAVVVAVDTEVAGIAGVAVVVVVDTVVAGIAGVAVVVVGTAVVGTVGVVGADSLPVPE